MAKISQLRSDLDACQRRCQDLIEENDGLRARLAEMETPQAPRPGPRAKK